MKNSKSHGHTHRKTELLPELLAELKSTYCIYGLFSYVKLRNKNVSKMRDSILVQEDEVGDHVLERRRIQSLLQLASDSILEKFVPPRLFT